MSYLMAIESRDTSVAPLIIQLGPGYDATSAVIAMATMLFRSLDGKRTCFPAAHVARLDASAYRLKPKKSGK